MSIIGGGKIINFNDKDSQTEKAFVSGLMKAAKIQDTWIITSGIDLGATHLIAKAIEIENNRKTFTLLGITDRKRIFGKYPQFKKKSDELLTEKNSYSLNQNNTSFMIFCSNIF